METLGAQTRSSSNDSGEASSESCIEEYSIGWICTLQEEYDVACRMLDDEYDGPDTNNFNDNNTYMFGRIGGHRVVVGCMPAGRYGLSSAASVAKDMVRSFPNLRFTLIVGIGGGAPTQKNDIRLGDVVVSVPQGNLGGVVQYDFGKRLSDGRFQQTGQLDAPPPVLLGVIPEMRRRHNDRRKPDRIAEHLELMDDTPEFQRPEIDQLYRADSAHTDGDHCENCDVDAIEERPKRASSRKITVHYGIIASANSDMRDTKERDRYANDPELNVLCFEMGAGGLMNNFPCLVIRGICDYSDSHKNEEWHNYAALAAAAYAKELLYVLKPQRVTVTPLWDGKKAQRE
jgi:nucleoside phosphorylase